LSIANPLATTPEQVAAWHEQVAILQPLLRNLVGRIYFEFDIPRMGRRIDVVVIGGAVVFVIEFKVGAKTVNRAAINQVWDYALDLKNFHETSHDLTSCQSLLRPRREASRRYDSSLRLMEWRRRLKPGVRISAR
jgi:hypothetical protein